MALTFQFQKPTRIPERKRLREFILDLLSKHNRKAGQITFVFCSDDYLLTLNKEYLQHDYYTDIITFDLSPPGDQLDAEIYISVDRVKDNSTLQGVSYQLELHRVIFHGILHLLGFKDKSPAQRKDMRKQEDFLLKSYRP